MRFLDHEQKEKIGYNYVIEKLHILSPYGRKKLKNLKPYIPGQEDKLNLEHQKIQRARELIEDRKFLSQLELLLMKLKDVRNTFTACRKGRILDEVELYEIKVQCMTIEEIRQLLKDFSLPSIVLCDLKGIIYLLDPHRDNLPTYHIYSSYSSELQKVREKKKRLEEMIYLEKEKNRIDELRNERLLVVVEEGEEELKVRRKLSDSLSLFMDELIRNTEVIGELDLLIAKGRMCNRYNLSKPVIIDTSCNNRINNQVTGQGFINLQIKDMVEAAGKEYTPIDISLDRGTTIITGANMGGKTVALKTITLNVFLFQMGFYPFADNVTMPLFDFIDFISDDMQDIGKGLSTFGAEMMKLKEIMIFLYQGRGFIALDEFARGTNPYEGQKIAKSLGEYLNKYDSVSLMATHYDGVVDSNMTHYQVVGLRDVDFDSLRRKIDLNKKDSIGILQKYMDYTLKRCEGYEAPRDALNIAMLLGIHKDFTDHILKNYKGEG